MLPVLAALARYGVVRCGRVASGPASKAKMKRAREQERGGNGRRACRLSAGERATMHPQCAVGPGCQERGRWMVVVSR